MRIRRFTVALVLASSAALTAAPSTPQSPGGDVCALTTTDRVVAIARCPRRLRSAHDDPQGGGRRRQEPQVGRRQDHLSCRPATSSIAAPDSRKALDLLRQLEKDAPKTGGRVIALLGNHEVMRVVGDTRYVSAGEYAAFRDARQRRPAQALLRVDLGGPRRPRRRARRREVRRAGVPQVLVQEPRRSARSNWRSPSARRATTASGCGRHDTMAIINGVAYMHGGASPETAKLGCAGDQPSSVRARARQGGARHAGGGDVLGAEPGRSALVSRPGARRARKSTATPEQRRPASSQALGVKAIVVGALGAERRQDQVALRRPRVSDRHRPARTARSSRTGRATALEVIGGAFHRDLDWESKLAGWQIAICDLLICNLRLHW